MVKPKINYFLDLLMALSFLITAITAIVLFFVLPSGVKGGRYLEFIGVQKYYWSLVHDWTGLFFILLVVLHFILHFDWVIMMTKNIFKKKDVILNDTPENKNSEKSDVSNNM